MTNSMLPDRRAKIFPLCQERTGIALVFAGCLLLLAACAPGSKPLKNPELACQMIPCVCAEDDAGLFEKTEKTKVLWRSGGDAYCPEGFHLEKKDKGDSFITDHGG